LPFGFCGDSSEGSIGPMVENVTNKEVVSWWLLWLYGCGMITGLLKSLLLLFHIDVLLGEAQK
jgi:hypothetical protein